MCTRVCSHNRVNAYHIYRGQRTTLWSLFVSFCLDIGSGDHTQAAGLACQLPSFTGPPCQLRFLRKQRFNVANGLLELLDLAATGQTAGHRAVKLL